MRDKCTILHLSLNIVCRTHLTKFVINVASMLYEWMVSDLQNACIIKRHSILDRAHADHEHMRTLAVARNLNRVDKDGK